VSGVAADAKLDVWKIFSDRRSGGHFPVLTSLYGPAFRQALDSGIRALNLSIGGLEPLQAEQDAVASLTSHGVTVVAAMGNEGWHRTEYPAGYDLPGLVAVGAVNERLERCAFSNCGHHIDLVAPGSNILSTFPHRKTKHGPKDAERSYHVMDGTSMATPLVTATAALVSSAFPALNPEQVEAHLCRTSTHLPAMGSRKRTDEYGCGLLNVGQALESST
jgi:thermitase